MFFKQPDIQDNTCRYVKLTEAGWEYGLVIAEKNTRTYKKHGVKPTMDEALLENDMALKGMECIKGAFA